ncbi:MULTISPECIES: tape measure protein [Streptococcus]|uniref:Tape measure protein n=1 Tax=Streptococcus caledonicus TaxID=2614158 RepID=A0ABW0UDY6_9STRE|nr:tape measure protein [Streptococcus sp. S784/96/1]
MADGKVTITVDLDGTSAQQGVKQLKSLLQGLGDSSSSGFNTGTKSALSFGTAMAVASKAVSVGMSAISSSMGGAISRYDTMNKFPKMMSALGYSADDAKNAVDELSKGIDGLPTALDEVVATAQGLTMMNGDLGKSTKLTLALNNAFLSSGASAGDASRGLIQFTQMMAKGEVDMQSWRTLMETMPVGLNKVAEAFGYTGASAKNDLYAALKEGHITFDQFSDKLIELNEGVGGFAELAQINSDGIATAMSRIKTAVVRNMEGVVRSFDDAAKAKGLPTITEGLDKFRLSISSAFSNATPYVSKFVDVLSWVVDAAKRMWEAFKNTGAVTALTQAFSAIQSALEHVFSSLGQNTGFVEGLGRAFGEVVKWVAEAVTKAAEFISSLPPGTIQAIASAVLGAVAAFKGIKTAVSAVNSLKTAFGLLKAALTGNPFMVAAVALGALVGWFIHAYTTSETFRAKVNEVVAVVSKVAGKIKEFLSGVDPSFIAMLVPVLGLLLARFKGFETISKFNPFSIFKKNAKDAFDGASGSASQSKGIIEQVFSGLGTLITSIAQGISTVLQGLATALSTVAQGFGTAAAMASPAQWLSMGAAMLMVGAGVALASAGIYVLVQAAIQLASAGSGAAIALVGLGVGIAAMAGVFALLGPALTASAVGMVAFGAAVALIGAGIGMAAAGLAMLASQLPTIATYGASAASAILALSGAVVAFGAGVTVAGAGLLVLSAGLIAFGAAALVATAGGVALAAGIVVVSTAVAAFGLALQPVASAVKKMGQGAKDAGAGTKQLASGLKSITSLPLGSLVTHLGAVAIGIGKISGKGGEIASVGTGMKQLGQGLTTIATSGMLAVTAMTVIGTAITQLSTQMTTLPATLTLATAGFATFSSQAVAGVAGLSAINAPLTALKTQIMTLAPACMIASAGLTAFGSQVMVVGASFTMLGAGITIVRTGLVGVSTAFILVGTSATSASGQVRAMASSTQAVIVAFNAMRGQVQSSMNAMLNVVKSVGNQMKSQGSQIGQQTSQNLAKGISSGAGQVSSAMQTLTNAARSAGMSGVGAMQSVGAMIGQGLAQGMLSALGAVTAAANALVAQAERAAQAKAKIHSPSRLFRDGVGRFIPQGVAVGITKDAYKVDDAMGDVFNQIQAFSFKAEDVIGVGKTKLSKVVQVKQELEQAVKASVEVAKEKSNDLLEKALDVAEKAVQRPAEMVLDDGTLVARTGDKYDKHQTEQARRRNRMRGIVT